jgi:hypothetical protein
LRVFVRKLYESLRIFERGKSLPKLEKRKHAG